MLGCSASYGMVSEAIHPKLLLDSHILGFKCQIAYFLALVLLNFFGAVLPSVIELQEA